MTGRVVVVGAGHAGTTLAGLLRQGRHSGPIVLFGDELDLPYQRPPLSKKFTDGQLEQWLRPPEFYREQGITIRLGERVSRIDRTGRRVHTTTGEACEYDHLVLATGARPRALPVPGARLGGVLSLRTLGDARALRKYVTRRCRLVIIGGGYVGLEVAAVARANGVEVTVVEREQRVLARVASPRLSEILAGHHTARGVRISTGRQVVRLVGDGQVAGVVLDDGVQIPCDTVLVGIGAVPRDELAVAAGLRCAEGIVVDAAARTSDPHILAIGDVTRRPVGTRNTLVRLESIPSATEQARQASATVLGHPCPAAEVPWFWSDQYDLKLKIAGIIPTDPNTVLRGDPSSGRFALVHTAGDAVVAVESANWAAEFMAGRKLIASHRQF